MWLPAASSSQWSVNRKFIHLSHPKLSFISSAGLKFFTGHPTTVPSELSWASVASCDSTLWLFPPASFAVHIPCHFSCFLFLLPKSFCFPTDLLLEVTSIISVLTNFKLLLVLRASSDLSHAFLFLLCSLTSALLPRQVSPLVSLLLHLCFHRIQPPSAVPGPQRLRSQIAVSWVLAPF